MYRVQSNEGVADFWGDEDSAKASAKATALVGLVIFVAAGVFAAYLGCSVCPSGFDMAKLLDSGCFLATFITGCSAAVFSVAGTICFLVQDSPLAIEQMPTKDQREHQEVIDYYKTDGSI